MKTKMLLMPLLFCLLMLSNSCKREKTEKELIIELKSVLKQKKLPKETFSYSVYPTIKTLHALDPKKYSLINNIAEKAFKENNPQIFDINIKDLKSESQYIKAPETK